MDSAYREKRKSCQELRREHGVPVAAYFCLFFVFRTAPQSSPFGLMAVLFWLWNNAAVLCVIFMHYQFVKFARAWDLAAVA